MIARRIRKPAPVIARYALPSEKLQSEVRLAFLSDLHAEDYGEGQAVLVSAVDSFAPHAVVIGGDTYDERFPWDKAEETIRVFAEKYLCLYVSGNHEIATHSLRDVRKSAKRAGALVLAGSGVLPVLNGQRVCIVGAEDPLGNEARLEAEAAAAMRTRELQIELLAAQLRLIGLLPETAPLRRELLERVTSAVSALDMGRFAVLRQCGWVERCRTAQGCATLQARQIPEAAYALAPLLPTAARADVEEELHRLQALLPAE